MFVNIRCRIYSLYRQRPTPTDGARPSKSVASSHESRAGSARDRMGRRGRKGETGAREKRREEKATLCTLSSTFPLQPLQQPQQPQQQLQRQCACSDRRDKFIAKPVVELLAMVDLDLSSTAILTSLMIFPSLRRSSAHLRRVWWVVVPWDTGFCRAVKATPALFPMRCRKAPRQWER